MKLHQAYLLLYLLISPLSYLLFFADTGFMSFPQLVVFFIIAACAIIQLTDLVYYLIGHKIKRPFLPLLILLAIFSGMFIAEQHHRIQSNNNRQRANAIIVQIQQYVKSHEGMPPEGLSLLNIEKPESYYGFSVYKMEYTESEERDGTGRYKLSYINRHDHTRHTYDSREQKWSKAPIPLSYG